MSVIFYAAAHAVPVVLAGAVTRNRGAVTLAAIVMGGLAIALGSARYAFIDLVFVAIGYFVALALCSTKAASAPQILQGDYRKLANNSPPALLRRDEQPSQPPLIEKLILPKAEWLTEESNAYPSDKDIELRLLKREFKKDT